MLCRVKERSVVVYHERVLCTLIFRIPARTLCANTHGSSSCHLTGNGNSHRFFIFSSDPVMRSLWNVCLSRCLRAACQRSTIPTLYGGHLAAWTILADKVGVFVEENLRWWFVDLERLNCYTLSPSTYLNRRNNVPIWIRCSLICDRRRSMLPLS